MDFSHENSNPNPNYTFFPENFDPMAEFQLSDYLILDGGGFEEDKSSESMASSEKGMGGANEISGATSRNSNMQVIYPHWDFSFPFFFSYWKPIKELNKLSKSNGYNWSCSCLRNNGFFNYYFA